MTGSPDKVQLNYVFSHFCGIFVVWRDGSDQIGRGGGVLQFWDMGYGAIRMVDETGVYCRPGEWSSLIGRRDGV